MIKVLYFSRLKEALGCGEEKLAADEAIKTAGDLLASLRKRVEPWPTVLNAEELILIAVNQEIATPDTAVADGDEIAFFPPVTGG